MITASQILYHGIRSRVLAKYLGQLAVVQALLFLLPLGVSLYYAEYRLFWWYLVTILMLLAPFVMSHRLAAATRWC